MSPAKYIPTIGIETHVQLKTKTKLFAAVGNDAREAAPNSLVSHICFGLPGALPVLNKKAIELSVRASYALQSEPAEFSKFDRKHYFYPDLPKGYQISQFKHPIIPGGKVDIMVDGEKKTIGITRAHLEEDAGKNTHPDGQDYSLVDLNRAGTPLLEIVSEPDIHSAAEARAYVRELYLLMKYADVSGVDLYHGNMRFDVNVSISKDPVKLGKRTETKNLNSFKSVERAVEYEIKRQTELLEKGQQIVQETRGWDEAKQKTTEQRSKEEAHDYRYFPDPDIPPVVLDKEFTSRIKQDLPELPSQIRSKLSQYDLTPEVIETILDNAEIYARISEVIERKIDKSDIRRMAFDLLENPAVLKVEVGEHIKVAAMVRAHELSSTAAQEALAEMAEKGIAAETATKDRKQVSDTAALTEIVQKVLAANPAAAEDVKNGEMKAIGFLVGQVMKESKGQANPQLAQELIKKELGI